MKNVFVRFGIRVLVCTAGIWLAGFVLGSNRISYNDQLHVVFVAGFILAIINSFLKPLVVLFSLPAILFSLGLFMVVINGLMLLLVSKHYSPLEIDNFGAAMVAGMIIGLLNYIVTTLLEKE